MNWLFVLFAIWGAPMILETILDIAAWWRRDEDDDQPNGGA